MDYENHRVPEGINVSPDHPLKEFFVLALAVISGTVLLVVILSMLTERLVVYIPFETEMSLARQLSDTRWITNERISPQNRKIERWLQDLGEDLSKAQHLPENYQLHFHYDTAPTVNAFATLGGHIVVYCGLLKTMPDENALAMILAHEIAHVKHRDPLISLGRGVTISLALASMAGFSDTSIIKSMIGHTSKLTTLSFNRRMESAADDEALQTLLDHYGHTQEAEYFFSTLSKKNDGISLPEFLKTHPIDEKRIQHIEAFTITHPQRIQPVKPLPDVFPKTCEE